MRQPTLTAERPKTNAVMDLGKAICAKKKMRNGKK
jgi:hypothetical protein